MARKIASRLQTLSTLRVSQGVQHDIWVSTQPVLSVPLDFGGYCDGVDSMLTFESAPEKTEHDLKRTRGWNIRVSR
ncbi:MAG TPA: hypothetical protein VJN69_11295 [Candidatus Acidoferrales bacterium]|nr:hypothetical protein [Candidatus Acidoferrales bacterium]